MFLDFYQIRTHHEDCKFVLRHTKGALRNPKAIPNGMISAMAEMTPRRSKTNQLSLDS
jgi:hypothetical protein